MAICQSCGKESSDDFQFCPRCGTELSQTIPSRQVRKVVTALFCDVTGSTALGERLDPEVLRGVLSSYFAEIRRIIEVHGGIVEKFIGDAVMAVCRPIHVWRSAVVVFTVLPVPEAISPLAHSPILIVV